MEFDNRYASNGKGNAGVALRITKRQRTIRPNICLNTGTKSTNII